MFNQYLLRAVGDGPGLQQGRGRQAPGYRSYSPDAIAKNIWMRDQHARLETNEEVQNEECDMNMDPQLLEDATRSIVWDVAVGCLAWSVKVR